MRPVKLIIQAFGPYSGHEEIDFTDLASRGLFLICGETGSGKTMILDAITFAIYGMSSGNTRDDFQALRCKGSDSTTDTVVRFEFEHDGVIYAFERRLGIKRKNLSASQNAYVREGEDLWRPLFENGKASDLKNKAVELLGLDYDQFRQVIILPQGQFEKLLVSNSEEKEKILSCIFGVSKWQRIADIMFEKSKERYDRLKRIREDIDARLAEDGCVTMDEFTSLKAQVSDSLTKMDEDFKAQDYDGRIRRLDSDIALSDKFLALRNLEKQLKEYEDKAELCKKQEEGLAIAEKADTLRPLVNSRNEALKNESIRESKLKAANNDLERATAASEAAQRNYDALVALNADYEANKSRKTILENRVPQYDRLETCREKAETAKQKLAAAKNTLTLAGESMDAAGTKATEAYAEFTAADNNYRALMAKYTRDIVGSLAADLIEGEPCPVCGSVTHPLKAQPAEGEPVSKDQLDSAKNRREEMAGEHSAALENVESAKKAYETCREAYNGAATDEKLASQELSTVTSGLIEGIATKNDLIAEIFVVDGLIKDYEKKMSEAEKRRNDATIKVKTCTTVVENSREERDNAHEISVNCVQNLENAIEEAGFGDETELDKYLKTDDEKTKARQYVARYNAGLEQCRDGLQKASAELEGRTEPDAEACRKEKAELMEARDSYLVNRGGLVTKLGRLEKKYKEVSELKATVDVEWKQAEDDMVIVRNLRGDTGIGLQRYVLGIMFRSVIREANIMLEHVHGGRYRLFTTDEKVKGSNKRGLDLKVEDAYHGGPEGRAVTTLSGGEKFLVSLALSIGMSSIAATGGIHIEAMFIDEGFGSLDSDSIEDAIGVLNTIRSANGMVGIISHVQLLRDTIPSKLVVHKSRQGSTVTTEIG